MFLGALSLLIPIARWISVVIAILVCLYCIFFYFPAIYQEIENDQFVRNLLKEHDKILAEFKRIKRAKKIGCPMGLNCKEMGFLNDNECENFKTCLIFK